MPVMNSQVNKHIHGSFGNFISQCSSLKAHHPPLVWAMICRIFRQHFDSLETPNDYVRHIKSFKISQAYKQCFGLRENPQQWAILLSLNEDKSRDSLFCSDVKTNMSWPEYLYKKSENNTAF